MFLTVSKIITIMVYDLSWLHLKLDYLSDNQNTLVLSLQTIQAYTYNINLDTSLNQFKSRLIC